MKKTILKFAIVLFTSFVIYLIFSPCPKTTSPQPAALAASPDSVPPSKTSTPKSSYYIVSLHDGDSVMIESILTDNTAKDKANVALMELGMHKDSIKWVQGGVKEK